MSYPYINDKNMYAAVMGACKMIRDTGYFNKAISYYSNRYNVDENELKKHINERQQAGKKAKKNNGYRMNKYKVTTYCATAADPEPTEIEVQIVSGKTKENVENRFAERDFKHSRSADYGGSYAPYFWSEVEEIN